MTKYAFLFIALSITCLSIIALFNLYEYETQITDYETSFLSSKIHLNLPSLTASESNKKYIIVIDSGSSGSRLYVYFYDSNKFRSDTLPLIEKSIQHDETWFIKQTPGISTYSSNISQVPLHLEPLLNFAKSNIPLKYHSTTPLFLFATAGMRLLSKHSSNEILKAACEYSRTHYHFFISNECHLQFRVISGNLEGILAWISVNYLKKTLSNSNNTFGLLDLGGASTQIAYQTSIHSETHNDITQIILKNMDGESQLFNLYGNTFLGMGMNEAKKRYIETLTLTDPCLFIGSKLSHPITSVVINGTSDFKKCIKDILPLLNESTSCPTCSLNNVLFPDKPDLTHFIGISEFWYTSNDILELGSLFTLSKLEQKTQQLCSKTRQELLISIGLGEYKNNTIESIENQCFKSGYILNLLQQGYQFNPTQLFQVVDSINEFPVTWTLGVAMIHVSSNIKRGTFSFLIIIGIIMIVLLFFYRKYLELNKYQRFEFDSLSNYHIDLESVVVVVDKSKDH